jgi:TatD DNase family protein
VLRAHDAGVERILAVGSDLSSSRAAVEAASRYPTVFAAVGWHPHQAGEFADHREDLRKLLKQPKVVAVGEIGLDFYRQGAPRAVQIRVFREQLEWAADAAIPASVHSRGAIEDVLVLLEGSGVTAVLHCFEGDRSAASLAVERGHYLSFAGNVTFRKSEDLRKLAGDVRPASILVESDAPVLAPQSRRGTRNEPAFISETAACIAEARGEPLEVACAAFWHNANTVFGWAPA